MSTLFSLHHNNLWASTYITQQLWIQHTLVFLQETLMRLHLGGRKYLQVRNDPIQRTWSTLLPPTPCNITAQKHSELLRRYYFTQTRYTGNISIVIPLKQDVALLCSKANAHDIKVKDLENRLWWNKCRFIRISVHAEGTHPAKIIDTVLSYVTLLSSAQFAVERVHRLSSCGTPLRKTSQIFPIQTDKILGNIWMLYADWDISIFRTSCFTLLNLEWLLWVKPISLIPSLEHQPDWNVQWQIP